MAAETIAFQGNTNVARRSGNFTDSFWHFDQVQSMGSDFVGEDDMKLVNELKGKVRMMLKQIKAADPLAQLEQIDIIQRLGLSYHFQDEIKNMLEGIYNNIYSCSCDNLYTTSLKFRLLRQHGYKVPQEIFNAFKDENGKFKAFLREDIMGILYLYEASFLHMKGESILEEAREFATKRLEEYIISCNNDNNNVNNNNKNYDVITSALVSHTLEVPLHWMPKRLEARWFINEVYERRQDNNPCLLQLAKLDYSMVQSIHQEELKDRSRWWRHVHIGQKLKYARDRLVDLFLWAVGVSFEPQLGYSRRMLTKVFSLITVTDDTYDVYGTIEELQLFTDIVERWDVNAVDRLPYYMKILFLALFNVTNEIAFDVLKEQGILVLKYLKKVWADLCKNYMKEAKWYKDGYTPTFQEYMENGWLSMAAPVVIVHIYVLTANPMTEEALKYLEDYPNIIRQSSVICRLINDVATSSNELPRGDVPKSVQCYMHEYGVSEDESREHNRVLIREAWAAMNEEVVGNSPLPQTFRELVVDFTRITFWMYHDRDWIASCGHYSQRAIDLVLSTFVHPFPFKIDKIILDS